MVSMKLVRHSVSNWHHAKLNRSETHWRHPFNCRMPKRRVHQNGCRSRSFHIVGYNFDVQLLLGGFSVRYKNHLFKFNRFVFIKIECVCSCSHDNVYIIQLIPIAVERERERVNFFFVLMFFGSQFLRTAKKKKWTVQNQISRAFFAKTPPKTQWKWAKCWPTRVLGLTIFVWWVNRHFHLFVHLFHAHLFLFILCKYIAIHRNRNEMNNDSTFSLSLADA